MRGLAQWPTLTSLSARRERFTGLNLLRMFHFADQFFAAAPLADEGRVLLAGGLYPLRGSRSAYRASVVCYDHLQQEVVWRYDQPKNYPFRAIAQANGVCAVLRDQNFVRCPIGLYRFDLATGESLSPACEVQGWKMEVVDSIADTFLFSWVDRETSRMCIVRASDGAFRERAFPYRSAEGGKTIERVMAADGEAVVAIFGQVLGRQVVYSAERWRPPSLAPDWETRTPFKYVVRNENRLLFWSRSQTQFDVGLMSLASGEFESSIRIPLANVEAIQPISVDTYALLAHSGVYLLDATSKTVSIVAKLSGDAFLDFGALACDAATGKLIVVTAGNHMRPGTKLLVVDL